MASLSEATCALWFCSATRASWEPYRSTASRNRPRTRAIWSVDSIGGKSSSRRFLSEARERTGSG